jgi:hypothetical protein
MPICPVCSRPIGTRAYLDIASTGHVRLSCDALDERHDRGIDGTVEKLGVSS